MRTTLSYAVREDGPDVSMCVLERVKSSNENESATHNLRA